MARWQWCLGLAILWLVLAIFSAPPPVAWWMICCSVASLLIGFALGRASKL